MGASMSAAAVGSIIARMAQPGSERAARRWLGERSALGELLGVEFATFGPMRLYRASDALMAHREAIEHHLFDRAMDLFDLHPTVTLYDLSNTYFEGEARGQAKALRGHSKDKRTDCPRPWAWCSTPAASCAAPRSSPACYTCRDARCGHPARRAGPRSPPRSVHWLREHYRSAASAPGTSTRKRRCVSRPPRSTACFKVLSDDAQEVRCTASPRSARPKSRSPSASPPKRGSPSSPKDLPRNASTRSGSAFGGFSIVRASNRGSFVAILALGGNRWPLLRQLALDSFHVPVHEVERVIRHHLACPAPAVPPTGRESGRRRDADHPK